jgi:hypothetical protein
MSQKSSIPQVSPIVSGALTLDNCLVVEPFGGVDPRHKFRQATLYFLTMSQSTSTPSPGFIGK